MGINPNSILFNVFGYLVIALLGATSSINSLNGDFVFDDTEVLVNNRDILPDTPLANVFRNDYWGTNLKSNHSHKSYRPLTILSFRWNYAAVGGLHPRGFHLVNIALHILISFLIWSVSLIILGKNKLFIGFLASVLFSVHPIHSEAVSVTVRIKIYINKCAPLNTDCFHRFVELLGEPICSVHFSSFFHL